MYLKALIEITMDSRTYRAHNMHRGENNAAGFRGPFSGRTSDENITRHTWGERAARATDRGSRGEKPERNAARFPEFDGCWCCYYLVYREIWIFIFLLCDACANQSKIMKTINCVSWILVAIRAIRFKFFCKSAHGIGLNQPLIRVKHNYFVTLANFCKSW